MKYIRMPIEKESPEQLGYDKIKFNLTESSVRDRTLKDLGITLDDILLCYGDHLGNSDLRKLIASESNGITYENLLITAGASSALFIIASSLLEAGDHIIIVKPNYATNIETPKAIGCNISYLDLTFENNFRIDIDRLRDMIKPETKYISLTYPHNPTGVMISKNELCQIIQIVESENCKLLLDETYREMTFGEILPIAATLSPNVISVSSLSKTYGIPGIRLGWLVSQDKDLMHTFLCAKELIGICGSVIDEAIGLEALKGKKEWLIENNARINKAFQIVKNWIENEEYVEWIEPEGSCVCFPRIKTEIKINMDEFHHILNKNYGTYVGPGHWFEFPQNYFRIGYAWPSINELKGGLSNISKTLRELIK